MKVIAEDLIGPFSAQWIGGLAPEMLKHPVSVELESVTIGESRLELRGSSTSMWQDLAAADFWVWLIGYESGNLRANLYHADRAPALQERAGSRRAFTLVVSPTARPETGKLASVLLGISPQQGKPVRSRSGLFSFVWPSPVLTTGSPVVVTASEAR